MKIRYPLILALLAGAAYGGAHYEATRIQVTCDDDRAITVINGSRYVCLTQQQADGIRHALTQRGV